MLAAQARRKLKSFAYWARRGIKIPVLCSGRCMAIHDTPSQVNEVTLSMYLFYSTNLLHLASSHSLMFSL